MRTIKKYASTLLVLAICLLILGSVAAFSQKSLMMLRAGRPEVKVLLSGTVERNDEEIPVEKASLVKSGEILDWTLTSVNEGDAPANQYKAVVKIPSGTQLVAGSATAEGSASVVYSIDNGKTFSAVPTVDEKQADGSIKKVAAPVSMYTEVRYEWPDPLNQGQTVKASYKVRLR